MENQKHILFISSWYPNRYDPTHGIFNRFVADAAALYNKVSVIHVCPDENLGQKFECIESSENSIITEMVYYKKVTSSFPLVSLLVRRSRVLKAFDLAYDALIKKAGKPDLIQLNVIMPMGIGAFHLAEKHKIPYVIAEHWSGYTKEDGNYKGFIQQFFTRRIVKSAKVIMPTSSYLQEAMLAHGLIGNYSIVPDVVNVHRFKPSEKEATDKLKRFIHISSLNDREKNVSGIIHAFKNAIQKNDALELNIVGEGVDKENYIELVQQLKLENKIKFKGRLTGETLVNEINANDALIMFSNYETFCLVNIEAFACGKPVITSNAGAIKTYMSPQLGIMVEAKKNDQLSEAILTFASGSIKFDSAFIRNFAVNNYSYEKIGGKLDTIYTSVLKTN